MSYHCKCKCKDFRDHVGNGPYVSGAATPTRKHGDVKYNLETEKRWTRENEAYVRLGKQGYELSSLKGADIIEKKASQEVELQHGKLYGSDAKEMQKRVDEVSA